MIIECIKCNKKFEVDRALIPENGRNIQCGSCNHVWWFKEKSSEKSNKKPLKLQPQEKNIENEIIINENIKTKKNKKNLPVIKNNKKFESVNLLIRFFNFLIVFIISLVAIILILDTFKNNFISVFPNLELIIYNLFETIKDVKLFINDLIR